MPLERLLAAGHRAGAGRLRRGAARRLRLGAQRRQDCTPCRAPGSTCSRTGRSPQAGDIVRFPALAATLKRIAKDGRDGFYTGEVAKDMVAELKALGGLHTLEDFAAQSDSASYVDARSRCPIAASTSSSCRPATTASSR